VHLSQKCGRGVYLSRKCGRRGWAQEGPRWLFQGHKPIKWLAFNKKLELRSYVAIPDPTIA
jgi:hypothetical protein